MIEFHPPLLLLKKPAPPKFYFIFAFGIVICPYYCCTSSSLGLLIGFRRVLRIQHVYIIMRQGRGSEATEAVFCL